ncbi:hypothetical protein PGT21_031296 [Puccinia graminis f. sp. tritici]|nr:hypothetical protein PGT21_031296 [Puccinia graminis f. sp. tritici]
MCSFCDEILPIHPSARFIKLNQYLTGLREARPRFSTHNPNALHLPFPRVADHCRLHRAEQDLIPIGLQRGWPMTIDFAGLASRVASHQSYLRQIVLQEIPSVHFDLALENWNSLGPRKVQSMAHEMSTFHVEQPGYYGVQGFRVIMQTLHWIFKSPGIPLHNAMSNEYVMRKVLVAEVAKCLIAEDLGLSITDPKLQEHLEDSRVFGSVLFP